MVNAANNEEALAVYDEMAAEMEAAGLSDVENYLTAQYQERMALWGQAD